MQIHRCGYGIRGFGGFSDYGLRYLVMVSEKAQRRYRAVQFWERYGLQPTLASFRIKRRTLYHWRKKLGEGGANPEVLNDRSKAPVKRRKRLWPKEIIEEIRRLRREHPNLGKEKLHGFVTLLCEARKLRCPILFRVNHVHALT